MSSEVLVGDKELDRYLTAIDKQFQDAETVQLLSRGQENNGKALDVAEILRRDNPEISVGEILTSTAEYDSDVGDSVLVTELEIELNREG
jgi:DNA-binding protein Alba